MKAKTAVAALAALAQENRLAVFRALVEAGLPGLCPGELGAKLRVAGPTLSFHLAQLRHAGLVTVRREGRSLHYAADFDTMNGLLGFLTENCCAADGGSCAAMECSPGRPAPKRKTMKRPR